MKAHTEKGVLCDLCGKPGARLRHVSRSYGSGRSLLIVENVPVTSCPHCGESYLSAEAALELDRIRENSRKYAVTREVPVVQFGESDAA
ncbi:MAG: type II toxin-antitoxin system MqsA family antitoxin [Gammaproteobacteria bacterium]|nr:type II toxin-antitoxin system MqsA family antitoxin [Gammaproteobacteria bacterium]